MEFSKLQELGIYTFQYNRVIVAIILTRMFSNMVSNISETIYLAIDSRYRDLSKFPDANNFIVEFDTPFKNIISIELVYALYDKLGTERYINLCIPEIRNFVISNNNILNGAFTQLPLNLNTNEYTSDKFRSIKVFNQPLSKLTRLSMILISDDGNPYPMNDYFARFEIVCSNTML